MKLARKMPLVNDETLFVHLAAGDLDLASDSTAVSRFLDCCRLESLPKDPYGADKAGFDGARVSRYRRFTTCRFFPGERGRATCHGACGRLASEVGCLVPLDGPDAHRFYQSDAINRFQGNNYREWAGIEANMFPFLTRWASLLHSMVAWQRPYDTAVCRVGFHLIGYLAQPGETVSCSPEGAHHDGYAYISMLHLNTTGVFNGGDSVIFGSSETELFRTPMRQRFEAVVINDRAVKHLGTSMTAEPYARGMRMILVTTLHQDREEVPNTPYFDGNFE